MRIAVSGAHGTGKSTLVAELAHLLPGYEVVEEPYYALLDEGHSFAATPSAEDFEAQLERCIATLAGSTASNVVFDRCPADYLAYLAAIPGVGAGAVARWFGAAAEALARLDLIVFVPIERPDRIHLDGTEGRRLRKRVDAKLRVVLVEDAWGLGVRVVEVRGTPAERTRTVRGHLDRLERLASEIG